MYISFSSEKIDPITHFRYMHPSFGAVQLLNDKLIIQEVEGNRLALILDLSNTKKLFEFLLEHLRPNIPLQAVEDILSQGGEHN